MAILACGVDRAYPLAHAALLDYIADVGLVISEAAPGFAPTRIRFLARNRLIAALTRGTVVVEAAVRSGALNTANWAASLSRTLMGVPGPVTSAPSQGVHQMIRARSALLVTDGRDVLEATSPAGEFAADRPLGAIDPRDCLTPEQRQVLDAVPVRQGVESGRIARTAGIASGQTLAALKALKNLGLVEYGNRRWRLAPAPSRLPGTEAGGS
ncbi:MAG: protecting protein DprA [Marmoricola sp.]|nr:protecting protein DprA [Marmoricola sp.]